MSDYSRRIIALSLIAGILSGMVLIENVSADITVVFTTTADFDSGNKSDPGNEYFAKNGVDQPMYWITNPTAMYAKGRTYVIWQAATVNEMVPYISYYDHASKTWAAPVQVASPNPVAPDGHGAPALFIDSSGFIHVFYGAHATALKYSRSTNIYDISAWTAMGDPVSGLPPQGQSSYPKPFEYNGKLYLLYREGVSTTGDWAFKTSTNHGVSWSARTIILDSSGMNSTYIGQDELLDGKLYYGFTWFHPLDPPGTPVEFRDDVFLCYLDLATGLNRNMSGANLGTTVTAGEMESCKVWDTGTSHSWYAAMKVASNGYPHMIFGEGLGYTETSWRINFTRWNGASWTAPVTIRTTDSDSNYADMIIRSTTNIEAFLVAPGLYSDTNGYSGSLERWTWNGVAWAMQETILSEGQSSKAVNHPVVPVNFREDLRLVFDQFGSTIQGLEDLKVYGWGSEGFVYDANNPSGNPGVETISNNPKVAANAFQLTSQFSDTFLVSDSDGDTWKWNFFTSDDGPECSVSISSSILTIEHFTGGTERRGCALASRDTITGNYNFTVQIQMVNGGQNEERSVCVLNVPGDCWTFPSTSNGILYRIKRESSFNTSSDVNFQLFEIEDGIRNQIGTTTSSGACFNANCWLRVVRTGTTFEAWFSSDGAAFTQDESTTIIGSPSAVYMNFGTVKNGGGLGPQVVQIRSPTLTTGTLGAKSFRANGAWVSPIQTYAGDLVIASSVTVDYSGASASNYIDSIGILDVDGDVIYEDGTDRTSGSTVTVQLPQDDKSIISFREDWSVQVSLKGDGSGSVIVSQVSAIAVFAETTGEITVRQAISGFWLVLFAFICVGMVVGAWLIHKRVGA